MEKHPGPLLSEGRLYKYIYHTVRYVNVLIYACTYDGIRGSVSAFERAYQTSVRLNIVHVRYGAKCDIAYTCMYIAFTSMREGFRLADMLSRT